MRGTPRFLLWLAPLALISCAIVYEARHRGDVASPPAPRPTVNHAAHLGKDLLCIDCHDPDETGTPVMPSAATCFDCHEDLAKENERVQAYFATARQDDGSYRFSRPAYMGDLIVNHEGHASNEVECASCHGEATEGAFARPAPLALMDTCTACHTGRGAPAECATCHEVTRKEVEPESHAGDFRKAHGKSAPAGWREGRGASCAICHEVPKSCVECHAETKPEGHLRDGFRRAHGLDAPEGWQRGEGGSCATCHDVPQTCRECHGKTKPRSHGEAGFRLHHGRGDTDAVDGPFAQVSCALCHEEQACVRCHQTTKPRSHTAAWERRLHGVAATVERQSCQTCHKQDYCATCHASTQPLSHRGNFAAGQQSHCLGCHEPLAASSCFACHKHTLGHLGQTPIPVDDNHIGASDPGACQACHMTLPHLYDGGQCRRCHR